MSHFSQARRQEVYVEWKAYFAKPDAARLRISTAIHDLVQRTRPGAAEKDSDLVRILQHLLCAGVFDNSAVAATVFPDMLVGKEAGEKAKPLPSVMESLLDSGDYSDLLITCGDKTYQVHKAVVCPQSAFFAKACQEPFKEGKESKIDLPDDDPDTFDMLIQYLYRATYTTHPHVGADEALLSGPDLLAHSQVYALAEKYCIDPLKATALNRFQTIAECDQYPVADLADAAHHAYSSTLDADRGLRDIVVAAVHQHRKATLEDKYMQKVVREHGDLAYDLLIYAHGKEKKRASE